MTIREYQQIEVAIDAMHSYRIAGVGRVVSAHNVKAILARFVDSEESPATQAADDAAADALRWIKERP